MRPTASLSRREWLGFGAASLVVSSLPACATMEPRKSAGRVVIVGGGFGGATAAKYLRLWSGGTLAVTLIEPNRQFISCPISNLVLGGSKTLADITHSYDGLRKWGVDIVHDTAAAIDTDRRTVRLAGGSTLNFDRLIVAPGVEFMFDRVRGMTEAAADEIPHAWKAGVQTVLLRRQLEAMPDGGVVLISVPMAPYRCPPGPYERTCQIAWYLKNRKPKSTLIVLDANPQVTSKAPLFTRIWSEDYAGIVEYRPNAAVSEVDVKGRAFVLDLGERFKGDVLNLIPPMRAGAIARQVGLVSANDRWCEVDWTTLESIKAAGVHVLGDATLAAPGMPKSGHMANQHGKVAAAAIVALYSGRAPEPMTMTNTCYSFIDDRNAIHVASVHRFVAAKATLEPVAGAGGVSSPQRVSWAQEGAYAWSWARTIWDDMLG